MIHNYVCGFCFDNDFRQVALIWKNKPAWQKGKLNGIGGKIEPNETPLQAMRREFKEETGVFVAQWKPLIQLSGNDWIVCFFCSVAAEKDFEYIKSTEDEEVSKIPVDSFDDFAHIENLRWLIPFAIDRLKNPEQIISTLI
jgi:8-oxo-dGTP diphosphatase